MFFFVEKNLKIHYKKPLNKLRMIILEHSQLLTKEKEPVMATKKKAVKKAAKKKATKKRK